MNNFHTIVIYFLIKVNNRGNLNIFFKNHSLKTFQIKLKFNFKSKFNPNFKILNLLPLSK